MAETTQDNSNLSGVDWSQYLTWPKVTTASGGVYYAVPGTAYVYDPFLSAAKKKPVLHRNPSPRLKAEADQQKLQDDAIEAQKKAASPLGQLAPVLGSTAGIVGSGYLLDRLTTSEGDKILKATENLSKVKDIPTNVPDPVVTTPSVPSPSIAPPAPTANNAFVNSATGNPLTSGGGTPYPVGTNVDGSTLLSDGSSLASDGSTIPPVEGSTLGTIGTVLSAAAAAKGTYDSFKAQQNGGEGLRSGLTTAGGGIGGLVGGPVGAGIGMATGNAIGYGLQDDGIKNDAALLLATGGMAAPLVVARHLGFNPIHKTTKQYQQERWGGLMGEDGGEAIAGSKEQREALLNLGDMGGKMMKDGQAVKWNFEDAKEMAKTNPGDFSGVYGNYKTFLNDWDTYNQEQKNNIVKGLIDQDLYYSDKGDVLIKNEDAARKVRDDVLSGAFVPTTPTSPAVEIRKTPPPGIRSATVSPGIAKDGTRMNYDSMGKELARRLDGRTR